MLINFLIKNGRSISSIGWALCQLIEIIDFEWSWSNLIRGANMLQLIAVKAFWCQNTITKWKHIQFKVLSLDFSL